MHGASWLSPTEKISYISVKQGTLMDNKEKAKMFLQMASSGDVKTAYEKFVAQNFRHHNQYFKGDRQSLQSAMDQAAKTQPNKSFTIKHIFEDGSSVITYSHILRNQDPKELAVVHIFKFDEGKIVELWDLCQPIDANSPNQNGMF
jgi:predicted SnoaL-like aldol condensation-catalyzing enzyme